MPFVVYDDEVEIKQHLNLSEEAWIVINDDIKSFSDGAKKNLSGFLNKIFANFYMDAEASIAERMINKYDELNALFSSPEFNKMDAETTKVYKDKILNVYEKELKDKAKSYEKGTGKKFRINKENVSILYTSANCDYYDDTIGLYLKALYEEYALKPAYERERIYFKDAYDVIKSAISQKKKVKLSIRKRLREGSKEFVSSEFYLAPYKIMQDKLRAYNYVAGYSELITAEGIGPRKVACFRISNIEKARIVTSISGGVISKKDKDAIDNDIQKKGVQFLLGDIDTIVVKFTDKGVENFNRHLYMRPNTYNIGEDGKTYTIECTERQAINYFFKFGKDVEIVSPAYLREKFINLYKDALNHYTKK